MLCTADISDCGTYRYTLSREWEGSGKSVAFIGMNPSTADANTDDPTIRRCMNFVAAWGGSKLIMVNLFAIRSTDPKLLTNHVRNGGSWDDLVGGNENQDALDEAFAQSDNMVAAWGSKVHGTAQATDAMYNYTEKLFALRLNKDGSPAHPLYLPKSLRPAKWNMADQLEPS